MITKQQIEQLREALPPLPSASKVDKLLKEWEKELLAMDGTKFEFRINNAKGDEIGMVIATRICQNFCVHKAIGTLKGFTVSHIATTLPAYTGTKERVDAFIAEFTNHPDFKAMDDAWTGYKGGSFKMSDAQHQMLNMIRKYR